MMKPITVGVIGYDHIGKRIADAIIPQPDFRLAGVYETDLMRIKMIRARGIPLVEGDLVEWSQSCEIVVVCQEGVPDLSVPMVYSPEIMMGCTLFPATFLPHETNRLRVASADSLAFARILQHLPYVERVFASCARRAGRITDRAFAMVDALEPIFDIDIEDADLRALLAPQARDICVRRTRVPYTHSHLHHIKLDLAEAISRDDVLDSLRVSPRVLVKACKEGFSDTGHLQEYYRDMGRRRGDRTEVFVWEESVAVVDQTVFLTADVSPDATPVPEIIDAVRCLVRPDLSLQQVSRITDQALENWR